MAAASAPISAVAATPRRLLRQIDSGVVVEGQASLQVAIEVGWPAPAQRLAPPVVLVCLPGGGMNRRYFDLRSQDSDRDFSFAEQMLARGHIVLLVDHPGTGDSSSVTDRFELTPERLVAAEAVAIGRVLDELRSGALCADLPPLPGLRAIGVGHSMGAVLCVLLQAAAAPFAALALLGFSTAGLPQYCSEPLLSLLASQGSAIRSQLAALARQQFAAPPAGRRDRGAPDVDLYASARADARGVAAIRSALAPMLPVPALLAMLPGNVAAECAGLRVPVYLCVGEFDMTGEAQQIPAAFTASHDVRLQVLEGAGHSLFLFAARQQLFDGIDVWLKAIAG